MKPHRTRSIHHESPTLMRYCLPNSRVTYRHQKISSIETYPEPGYSTIRHCDDDQVTSLQYNTPQGVTVIKPTPNGDWRVSSAYQYSQYRYSQLQNLTL